MTQVIIIGYGGHGKVIEECIESNNTQNVLGYIDRFDRGIHLKHLGTDDSISDIIKIYPNVQFIIGIGDTQLRRKLFSLYESYNVKFATVIHKSANISPKTMIGDGTVVFPQAVINPGAIIGRHCIINSGAIIEHDNTIEDNVHFAPRSVTGGQVKVGKDTLIGLGACVRNNIIIGSNCIVGMGASVVDNIPDNVIVYGVPAKQRSKNQ
ncbi:acetyltransferase [Fusibacter sp. JL216-2]|uniref:acetyltransferase n=1 Tax=Fusibacter sp. JL216-2 TaxID=3071453 RepID=UPI003D34492A